MVVLEVSYLLQFTNEIAFGKNFLKQCKWGFKIKGASGNRRIGSHRYFFADTGHSLTGLVPHRQTRIFLTLLMP